LACSEATGEEGNPDGIDTSPVRPKSCKAVSIRLRDPVSKAQGVGHYYAGAERDEMAADL
jgi:hypothetical protein